MKASKSAFRDTNMARSSSSIDCMDIFYPAEDEIYPISDDKYAEELQLQEALNFSSSSSSHSPSSSSKLKQPFVESYEPSKPPTSFCAICMEAKAPSEMFLNRIVCDHLYCIECIRGHVGAKMQENQIRITCPDPNCQAVIGPDACRYIMPAQVLERWENVLRECLIFMETDDGEASVTSSERLNCNRPFCVQCKVAWHCGMNYVEYKRLKRGHEEKSTYDMLTNFAKKRKWNSAQSATFLLKKLLVVTAYLAGLLLLV